jgi:hypothetical protein
VYTRQALPPGSALASIARTMHWAPKRSEEGGILDRRGVERDLVRARLEHLLDVIKGAQAPAHGERHEALLGGLGDHVVHDAAVITRRRDIEKHQLVRALSVIGARGLDRIAGVAQFEEFDTLHDPPGGHVEAGNDPSREHRSGNDH